MGPGGKVIMDLNKLGATIRKQKCTECTTFK